MNKLHILLVEDSATDAKLVMNALAKLDRPLAFERVQDAEAMRAALDAQTWNAIICDWTMPKFSALAALELVKVNGVDVPFIIVSGTVGEEVAVLAMRSGAHDYVLKDRLARLVPVVEREMREHELRVAHQKSAEALSAIETRFSRLSESGIIGVVAGDLAGNILEANDAFLKMVGFSREDLALGNVQWRHLDGTASQRGHGFAPMDWGTDGIATPREKEYVRKDGSRIPVLVGSAKLDDTRTIGFIVDLTAQKRAEESLLKSEEQLRQVQKMEAVGRLAGGVAHDFNNMLSVILSYATLVQRELGPDDPMQDDLEQIKKAGLRAADLTRQLLTFSRQEVVDARVIDLNALIVDMDSMLQRILGEDIHLVFLPVEPGGRIRVNPSHIEQVILNLVVNARDAMPTGGKLTIETQNINLDEAHARGHLGIAPGPYIALVVTDSGCGMDAATQARIFEPFYTTKGKGKGTGLGLSTVFGIVQQCEGSIWVSSEVGTGTTFKVYIPRVDAAADALVEALTPLLLAGSETILLVEDEDQIRVVAREILQKQGYNVIEARNAGEALQYCETHREKIHLLLTDVVMPQMSGPELAKRCVQARPGVKVLCMSGYTDDALVRHGALESGMAYLQKPITPDILARKVRLVLDAK